MELEKIIDFMDEIAPREGATEYDNVGLLAGRRNREVTKILTALDCTIDTVREAAQIGAELIVCHHPVMFDGIKKITDETKEGEMLLFAIENNIALFAAHTNLDFAAGGLNDYFLQKLGFKPSGTILENEGRIFDCNITGTDLCKKIKKAFDIDVLRVNLDMKRKILKGAVCTGSGKSLADAAAEKADVYITGDMGHHDILNLIGLGCGYIEISHYDSEKIVMELLKEQLGKKFPHTQVFVSEANKNPLTNI